MADFGVLWEVSAVNSWKTTIFGILTGLSIVAPQIIAFLDGDPSTVFDSELFLGGLAAMGIGIVARDNNVSSETAGAK